MSWGRAVRHQWPAGLSTIGALPASVLCQRTETWPGHFLLIFSSHRFHFLDFQLHLSDIIVWVTFSKLCVPVSPFLLFPVRTITFLHAPMSWRHIVVLCHSLNCIRFDIQYFQSGAMASVWVLSSDHRGANGVLSSLAQRSSPPWCGFKWFQSDCFKICFYYFFFKN